MLDTLQIYEDLKKEFSEEAARKLAILMGKVYTELANTVTKEDFRELKETVSGLAQAQKESEQRLLKLEQSVNELAQAQRKTEQRVEELAQAQKKTEQRVEELAQAQKKTEVELKKLIYEHSETRRQLGGISNTIGYTLENEAYRALPSLLKRDHGIKIQGRLKRTYVRDREGNYIEVNIIGDGRLNGREVTIIGECKAQISRNDINDFIRKKLKRLEGIFEEIFPVVVTHMISAHDVEDYARKKGIRLYYSYEF